MSNDQPPPPGDDPFRKQPPEPSGPGGPGGGGEPPPPPPPQGPPPGSPYGPGQGGGPYGGAGQGGPYGSSAGGTPPPGGPYDQGPYGGGPYGGAPDPLAGMPPLADFGRRFAARVIDALIIFVPLFVISLLVGWGTNSDDNWDDVANQVNTGRQWLWSLIALVAYVAYDTLMVKKSGQTVGKRLLKLRVAMLSDGSTPDAGASLIRAAVLWVPALVCCFCLWWIVIIITILVDKPYRQGLHDKAAKTVVVTVPEGPPTPPSGGTGTNA